MQLAIDSHKETDLLEIVRQTSWGAGLDDALLRLLISNAELRAVPAQDFICREGDRGDFMAFIISGRLRVLKRNYLQLERLIAQLGPGDSFGEMALVDEEPRSASIQVVEPAELLVLSAPVFRQLLSTHPEAAVSLLMQVSRVLSQRVRYLNHRVLERLV